MLRPLYCFYGSLEFAQSGLSIQWINLIIYFRLAKNRLQDFEMRKKELQRLLGPPHIHKKTAGRSATLNHEELLSPLFLHQTHPSGFGLIGQSELGQSRKTRSGMRRANCPEKGGERSVLEKRADLRQDLLQDGGVLLIKMVRNQLDGRQQGAVKAGWGWKSERLLPKVTKKTVKVIKAQQKGRLMDSKKLQSVWSEEKAKEGRRGWEERGGKAGGWRQRDEGRGCSEGPLIASSMVINQSFYIGEKEMLPQANCPYQQYFLFQAPQVQFSPYMMTPNGAYYLQPYPAPQPTHSFFLSNSAPVPYVSNGMPAADAQLKMFPMGQTELSQTNRLNKSIIKEKIIKKPANRPATYLTERKYYLAQTLPEDKAGPRQLRQRNPKRKHHRTHDTNSHPNPDSHPQLPVSHASPSFQELPREKDSGSEGLKWEPSQAEGLDKRESLTHIPVRESKESESNRGCEVQEG